MHDDRRLRNAFRKRLDAFAEQLPGVEEHRVDAVHGARVATRRLREIVPLLQLEHRAVRKLSRRLKRITHALGTVRELDVLCLLVAEFERANRTTSAALNALRVTIELARDQARRKLMAKGAPTKMKRLVARLERASDDLACHHKRGRRSVAGVGRLPAVEARIVRRAAQLQATIDRAACLYAPALLHDIRISLKKLRYAAELSEGINARRAGADFNALKEGQELLGRLHDLEMLVAWARDVQVSRSRRDLNTRRELTTLVRAIEDDCRHLHARFLRDRAKLVAVANRLRTRSESTESSKNPSGQFKGRAARPSIPITFDTVRA